MDFQKARFRVFHGREGVAGVHDLKQQVSGLESDHGGCSEVKKRLKMLKMLKICMQKKAEKG